jgi:hypothetical protein
VLLGRFEHNFRAHDAMTDPTHLGTLKVEFVELTTCCDFLSRSKRLIRSFFVACRLNSRILCGHRIEPPSNHTTWYRILL